MLYLLWTNQEFTRNRKSYVYLMENNISRCCFQNHKKFSMYQQNDYEIQTVFLKWRSEYEKKPNIK